VPEIFSVVKAIETSTETAFFNNIEPYRNCGFMISIIDGFDFSV